MMLISATKPPAFDPTDRNAVTGVGAPSYVSGAQKWNGTALTLNANPTSDRNTATVSSAAEPCATTKRLMSRSFVDPESAKINDMPESVTGDDSTVNR